MLDGFTKELEARKADVSKAKADLEAVYAQTLGKPDKDVIAQPELLQRINNFLAAVDAAFTSLNGTIKSVKTSVDS